MVLKLPALDSGDQLLTLDAIEKYVGDELRPFRLSGVGGKASGGGQKLPVFIAQQLIGPLKPGDVDGAFAAFRISQRRSLENQPLPGRQLLWLIYSFFAIGRLFRRTLAVAGIDGNVTGCFFATGSFGRIFTQT